MTFTPAPDSHYRFGAWSGAGCTGYSSGTGGSITFTNPAAAKACTANWVATVTVAWTAIGAGYGTISVYSSSNATCTPTDSRNGSCMLDSGASQVQLKAQPTGGSVSNGWTGAGCEQWTYPAGGGTLLIVTNPTVDIYCGAGFS